MTTKETLAELEATLAERNDPDFTNAQRFIRGEPVTEAAIAARERELEISFPPSYRAFLLENGRFTLGDEKKHGHHAYVTLDLDEHRTALEDYAEQLECKPTAKAVAEEIGMEPEVVKVLSKIVLVGRNGHEDFIGFDLRSLNRKTKECSFTMVLFDDTEIEALSEEEPDVCESRGFDDWLPELIEMRTEPS
jgi:hypothetical protein